MAASEMLVGSEGLPVGLDRFLGRVWPNRGSRSRTQARDGYQPQQQLSAPCNLAEEFCALLEARNVTVVFQPIVNLTTGTVYGYEALTRGPKGSAFASPQDLFSFAQSHGYLYTLERLTREKAISEFGSWRKALEPRFRPKLFLNVNPRIFQDPSFASGRTRELVERIGMVPGDIAFEITERSSIEDMKGFRRALEHYRNQGFMVAIDDTGSGYSNLALIAEIQPEFIKVDRALIHNIDQAPIRRALVETLVTFGEKTNIRLIAEGIETEAELAALQAMGLTLGQGFYLAPPASPVPELSEQAKRYLTQTLTTDTADPDSTRTIGSITCLAPCFPPETPTREVAQHFERYPTDLGAVITKDQEPIGLVMQDKLNHKLASQYGVSLYWGRPVAAVMDSSPLIIEHNTSLELASQLATSRPSSQLYDDIIVTRDYKYLGSVSIRTLLNVITQIQVELARHANPLTGLPGNVRIDQEIDRRLAKNQPFTLIYADLDDFKAYNDHYGFQRGDQAIRFTAEVITACAQRQGEKDIFIGHIGGDDFVIITASDKVQQLCDAIIANFDSRVEELYDEEDARRGYIKNVDRLGHEVIVPLLSLSLAVVESKGQFRTRLEIAEVAAELKRYAKSRRGSLTVRDRRRTYQLRRSTSK